MTPRSAPAGSRLRILVLTPYFLPAQQGGGSVTAVLEVVRQLRHDFDFTVVARNHDLNSHTPFTATACAQAEANTGARLLHLPRGVHGYLAVARLLREPWSLVYLNSLMAPDLGLWPLLWRRLHRQPRAPAWLVAPRGELMPGARAQRSGLKSLYLGLMRHLGLWAGLHWHATSADEAQAIRQEIEQPQLVLAPDLPVVQRASAAFEPRGSAPLRVLFLSRIDPVKNLSWVLSVLERTTTPVDLRIVGPVGDAAYWAQCAAQLARLPANVQATCVGPVPPAEVPQQFAHADLLFLPTLGENHGYVIAESLAAGCPVLISDRTPWRDLARHGVGADLALTDAAPFLKVLTAQAALSPEEQTQQRARCQALMQARQADDTAAATLRQALARLAQPNARIDSNNSGHGGAT